MLTASGGSSRRLLFTLKCFRHDCQACQPDWEGVHWKLLAALLTHPLLLGNFIANMPEIARSNHRLVLAPHRNAEESLPREARITKTRNRLMLRQKPECSGLE